MMDLYQLVSAEMMLVSKPRELLVPPQPWEAFRQFAVCIISKKIEKKEL